MLGTQEAIRQSQSKERREEHRARRCNLIATCVKSSIRSREINGRQVVLRDQKLYIDTGTAAENPDNPNPTDASTAGHPFAGYFLPYPDAHFEGLVSTITDVAPILNWIYVDKDTYEVKYGVRADAQPHLTGPFDCTRQDRRMTCEGWEGFVAVEEYPAVWALYFDRDDDGLRGKVPFGTRVLEIELQRREKKVNPEALREQKREQEILRRQLEAQKEQQRQEEDSAEQPLQEQYLEGGMAQAQPQPQRSPESDAEDGDHETGLSQAQSLPAHVHPAQEEAGGPLQEAQAHAGQERPSTPVVNETDFATLRISTAGYHILSAKEPQGTVATPTETVCAASIWSAQEENPKPDRNDSVVSYATPDSSILGDDEVTAAEAAYRENDAVGAPSPLFQPKYKRPYVEDSDE
ncbi:hypothetical protein MPH_12685 [Macrophomina phaseolina MS6]|uniref:Uncharacterized protein n=1 Tax=Macrophomina phaseolina (strain MS6) TaxID=1126212 RepID=K2S0I5_MACPH|nr:hypothetical protein MPH_12685 [Macrophomina phaseolina MS6]